MPSFLSSFIATKITIAPPKTRRTRGWEALLPELGWVGFDPTNNLIAGERHIRVAIGRDYGDVPQHAVPSKAKQKAN